MIWCHVRWGVAVRGLAGLNALLKEVSVGLLLIYVETNYEPNQGFTTLNFLFIHYNNKSRSCY